MAFPLTDDEQRAFEYRRRYTLRPEFERFLQEKLIPSAEKRRQVMKDWQPLLPGDLGDTSDPRLVEDV